MFHAAVLGQERIADAELDGAGQPLAGLAAGVVVGFGPLSLDLAEAVAVDTEECVGPPVIRHLRPPVQFVVRHRTVPRQQHLVSALLQFLLQKPGDRHHQRRFAEAAGAGPRLHRAAVARVDTYPHECNCRRMKSTPFSRTRVTVFSRIAPPASAYSDWMTRK